MPTIKTIGKAKPKSNESWGGSDPFIHSTRWRKLRKVKIQQTPLCEICTKEGLTKKAAPVDHHRPRRLFPQLELVLDNLTSMCESHHRKKSLIERDCQTVASWELAIQTHDLYKK